MKNIFNPPKVYIDYRSYVHGLSGTDLTNAQEKFYKKNAQHKTEICKFFNWMIEQRNNFSLLVERIEVREADHKKHGNIISMMIYDIEYWIEGGEIKQRKIYVRLNLQIQEPLDLKMRSAREREIGEEG